MITNLLSAVERGRRNRAEGTDAAVTPGHDRPVPHEDRANDVFLDLWKAGTGCVVQSVHRPVPTVQSELSTTRHVGGLEQ